MPIRLKGCARCGGDMWLDWDPDDGPEWACFLCGHRMPLPPTPRAVPEEPPEVVNARGARHEFFEEHKYEMLADSKRLDYRTFLRTYGLAKGTWSNLSKRWREEAVTA